MTRFPVVWHFHDDEARARPAGELIQHGRPDLAYRSVSYRGERLCSPTEPDLLLVPAALVHTVHGDGRRVIVLHDGAAAPRAQPEARVVRTPTELLEALAAWVPPSERRQQVALMVDDCGPIKRSTGRALAHWLDTRLVEAGDNTSGLAAAHHHRPAVIITDLIRPGGCGRAFVETLLEHHELCERPVIMLSGNAQMLHQSTWAERVGLVALIEKPCETRPFLEVVAYALGLTQMPPRAPRPVLRDAPTTTRPKSHLRVEHVVNGSPSLPVNMDWRCRRREYLDARAGLRR